jgi:hypothetical protein
MDTERLGAVDQSPQAENTMRMQVMPHSRSVIARPRHSLRLAEVAWLRQETVNATRHACRTGTLAHTQHGRCIEIPVDELRKNLRSTRALRTLDLLLGGHLKAPTPERPSSPPAPLTGSVR